ncbi:TolC family protein [Empedobacter sp. 225-1]|uniref:TolC family protein n=1 Tax=unclassified Empedobacter TaxID=2643773 RepID=UPI002574A4D7|nr:MULTISPECIES: TolC family protein [unclassified Empedobacter]MDM1523457.1 TolC family protein [Empedobacter sp. 225-1]MDM1543399.1 TolC family protein [Empedobacter sp. 189-2]
MPIHRYYSYFVLISSFSFGQQLIDPQLKLPVEKAIESSYNLKNKQLEVDKNNSKYDEIKGKQKPSLSAIALGSYLNSNGTIDIPTKSIDLISTELFAGNQRFNTSTGLFTIGINASQVIFSGLQIPNALNAIQEKSVALDYLKDAEKDVITKDILQTYDQLMLIQKVEELISNSAKRLDKEHLKVQKAIQNGLAIPYDREKIKLALLELEARQVEVNGSRQLLYKKLETLTHLSIEDLQQIEYELTPIHIISAEYTLENKKELKALEHSIKAYEFLYKKEKGSHLPQVFAFANTNYTSIFGSRFKLKDVDLLGDVNLKMNQFTLFPNILIGIGAKWELLDGGQHKNRLLQAKTDILINENKLKDSQEKLNLLLSKNKIDYETSSEKLKVNHQQNTIATNNLEIASRRFQEGLIDVTERLAAENDFYKANLGYYSQIIDQRSKTYELLQTSGELFNQISN